MEKQLRGKLENLKGRAKQAAGTVTGNKRMEAEGAVERAKGAVKETVEKAKDKLRREAEPARADDAPDEE